MLHSARVDARAAPTNGSQGCILCRRQSPARLKLLRAFDSVTRSFSSVLTDTSEHCHYCRDDHETADRAGPPLPDDHRAARAAGAAPATAATPRAARLRSKRAAGHAAARAVRRPRARAAGHAAPERHDRGEGADARAGRGRRAAGGGGRPRVEAGGRRRARRVLRRRRLPREPAGARGGRGRRRGGRGLRRRRGPEPRATRTSRA